MDLVKIPGWWGGQDKKSRPNTVNVTSARHPRTRTDLLAHRTEENRRTNTRLQEVPGVVPDYEVMYAGAKGKTRDDRDRATIQSNYETVEANAHIQFQNEINGFSKKYSTLTGLKQGRLFEERRDTERKTDEMLKMKSLNEFNLAQMHTNLAKKKSKGKVRNSRSQVYIPTEKEDPRNPSLKYVKNPIVKTQRKLFAQRKKKFLRDMKKCEEVYANHKNAEQRLNNREN